MKASVNIAYLAAVFFVPLLPAYLLHRLLPGKSTVRGPFKGLNINLTGAFGGYFLLALIAFGFLYPAIRPPELTYEVWRVTGNVEVVATDPETGEETNAVVGTRIGQARPELADTKGGFATMIIVTPGLVKGQRLFPSLAFYREGYTSVELSLASPDTDQRIDEEAKVITINEVITLEELSDREESKEKEWMR